MNDYKSLNYIQFPRWVSYFYQIEATLKTRCKNILEIGPGNKLVSNYLKSCGLEVTTFDNDISLNPDIHGDIRDLKIKEKYFDCVLAFEILEHIPYNDFQKVLKKLKNISTEYVIISLPCVCAYVNFMLRFSRLKHYFGKEYMGLSFRLPFFWKRKTDLTKGHFWEIGWRGFSLRRIKKELKKHFYIEDCFSNPICPYHKFFILRVMEEEE